MYDNTKTENYSFCHAKQKIYSESSTGDDIGWQATKEVMQKRKQIISYKLENVHCIVKLLHFIAGEKAKL